jgi:lipoyl(octanoyl) transferase
MELLKNKSVFLQDLGLIDYQKAWDYQEEVFSKIVETKVYNRLHENAPIVTSNFLLLCQHPHVFTLGKSGKQENLLANDTKLKEIEARFYKINRGGDITYHGPGQLVGYPILDLENFFTDIHKYLRLLEEAIIKTCAFYGIVAGRYPGYTGVWIDAEGKNARKICAMGVRCSRWVTMHGFAFNVNTNLNYFKYIVPCGIDDKAVTSIQAELGREINMQEVMQLFIDNFKEVFEAGVIA